MKYIKILNPQELGFRNGVLRTGGYFYISKKSAKLFFGELSKGIKNDQRILSLKSVNNSFEEAEITFVYHNDKWNTEGGTRDEYRIYLNRQIQFHALHFMPGDIVVFERKDDSTLLFLHLKQSDEAYALNKSLLDSFGTKGNHALISDP